MNFTLIYSRYRLRPRVLRDVSNRQLSTTILGHPVDFPICISPTAGQGFATVDGDKETARGKLKDPSSLQKLGGHPQLNTKSAQCK